MPEQKRELESFSVEREELLGFNDIYYGLFCIQNISHSRRSSQKRFVDCYLTYLDEMTGSYESIILQAQEDARQIINLAKKHAEKIIEDAERRGGSLAAPLQKIRATL